MTGYTHLGTVSMWSKVVLYASGETTKVEPRQDITLAHKVSLGTHDRWLPVLWPEIDLLARKHSWFTKEAAVGTVYSELSYESGVNDRLVELGKLQEDIARMVARYEQMIHERDVLAGIVATEAKQ